MARGVVVGPYALSAHGGRGPLRSPTQAPVGLDRGGAGVYVDRDMTKRSSVDRWRDSDDMARAMEYDDHKPLLVGLYRDDLHSRPRPPAVPGSR